MFENLLHQDIKNTLIADIKNKTLPQTLLFCGPQSCGKLTAALELARVLSCKQGGQWTCNCLSCKRQKSLIQENVMLIGTCDCLLEIKAAMHTLLFVMQSTPCNVSSSVMFFIRAVRKLTLRFCEELWQGSDKLPLFGGVLQAIDEALDDFEMGRLPKEKEALIKKCDKVLKLSSKLYEDFLYNSIPVDVIRNVCVWCKNTSDLQKVVIIQNAHLMQDSARNSMLKILEEPPRDTTFILLAQKKSALLPTILSRSRVYQFAQRTKEQEQEVIKRIFRDVTGEGFATKQMLLNDLLLSYLDTPLQTIKQKANDYFIAITKNIAGDFIPSVIETLIKDCGGFKDAKTKEIFLQELSKIAKQLAQKDQKSCLFATKLTQKINEIYAAVSVYNLSMTACLESLTNYIIKLKTNY